MGDAAVSYCDCDYDYDAPSFCKVETVKRSRKQHVCCECSGPIFVGESYEHITGVWDGALKVYRECAPCREMRRWAEISMPCFCSYTFGELHERIREMVKDVRRSVPGFYFEWGRRYVRLKRRRGSQNSGEGENLT
jgi:hypothetical protein